MYPASEEQGFSFPCLLIARPVVEQC